MGRSVAAHSGMTTLDITSCYNVGKVTGRGSNIAAIIGAESGFGEFWDDNAGGTTVNNTNNYYSEDSVETSSEKGVLFQQGGIDAAQSVSAEMLNSEEVVRSLNATDAEHDHYAAGETTPILRYSADKDLGLDTTTQQGEGEDDATAPSESQSARATEKHMYAVSADSPTDFFSQIDVNLTLVVLVLSFALCVVVGVAWQLGGWHRQRRKLKAVPK